RYRATHKAPDTGVYTTSPALEVDVEHGIVDHVGRARDRYPSAGNHHVTIGDPERRSSRLFDDEDREALRGEVRHHLVQLGDDERRETHRDLVEEQQLGIGGQRPRHREHLLLPAGERAGNLLATPTEDGE